MKYCRYVVILSIGLVGGMAAEIPTDTTRCRPREKCLGCIGAADPQAMGFAVQTETGASTVRRRSMDKTTIPDRKARSRDKAGTAQAQEKTTVGKEPEGWIDLLFGGEYWNQN